MQRASWAIVALYSTLLTIVTGNTRADELVPVVKVPTDVTAAIYLPKDLRDNRFPFPAPALGGMQLGNSVEETALDAARRYFASAYMVEDESPQPYSVLIALHPKFKGADHTVTLTMAYKVFGPKHDVLTSGEQSSSFTAGPAMRNNDVIGRLFEQAIERSLVQVINEVKPTLATHPASGSLHGEDLAFLVDHDKPMKTGTGFYINANGVVLTAAHVIHNCAAVEIRHDAVTTAAKIVHTSNLMDLAVIDTGQASTKFLKFREGALSLGEPVISIGYPLQDVMSDNPSVTRGSLSSRAGLNGSAGQFQFSAPIQPGDSGGPVIAAGGEVVGVTTATINATQLIKQGVLPQNVNFALEERYIRKFLTKNSVPFSGSKPGVAGAAEIPVDQALPSVVGVKCYE